MKSFRLKGEAEQEAFGGRLSEVVGDNALIFLEGDLGAGKTTLVRGFLHARGHAGSVKSPTYTLIEPYQPEGRAIYHLDLYRLGDPEELEYLGLREMLEEEAVLLVEWPQRGLGWLPAPDLVVALEYAAGGAARKVVLRPFSSVGEKIISRLSAT